MINVLLVDPNPNSLVQTQRALYGYRHQWNLLTAQSARDALTLLASKNIDAVFATQDLPDVRGEVFIQSILEDYPNLIGAVKANSYKDFKQLARKPSKCVILDSVHEIQALIDCVNRSVQLSNTLTEPNLIQFVSGLEIQPPRDFPEIFSLEDLKSYENNLRMCAEIREMNALAFHGNDTCDLSIEKAFFNLSSEIIRALYIKNVIRSTIGKDMATNRLQRNHEHSIAVSCLSRFIMREEQVPRPMIENATVAGLLHNIGSIIMIANFGKDYLALVDYAREQKVSLADLQRKAYNNLTTAEISAYYLSQWGFNNAVVEAVAYHLNPTLCPVYDVSPLLAVHVSNALVTAKSNGALQYAALSLIDRHYIKATGTTRRLPIWEHMYEHVDPFKD